MKPALCPHCKTHRLLTARVPKDVVVVMPCTACHELSILFRGRIIPLNRRLLAEGSKEERVAHIAEIVSEFMDLGMPFLDRQVREVLGVSDSGENESEDEEPAMCETGHDGYHPPISEEEFKKFVRIDLKCLDNSDYFRRHFG